MKNMRMRKRRKRKRKVMKRRGKLKSDGKKEVRKNMMSGKRK